MNEALKNRYSLIVIGGGITGLSTAIAYAKHRDANRDPVLLVEKQPIVGGMVTSFKRGGYLFDTAQLIPDPVDLLEYLGVECELRRFEGYFARIFLADGKAAKEIRIPSGYDAFKRMLLERYPAQGKAIGKFFDRSKAIYEELRYLKLEPSLIDLCRTLFLCPNCVRNLRKTFSEYCASFGFSDPELLDLFDIFAAFGGLPAERTVAILTASVMNMSLLGSWRPARGFIHLPQAMKRRAVELGCTVRTRTGVKRIIVENGAAAGIELDTGEVVRAGSIVTTVDTKYAMEKLVGIDTIRRIDPRYADKARTAVMSPSSMTISLGLDDSLDLASLGLNCGYTVITTGRGTFEKLFREFDRGAYILDEKCFHTAVICPSLVTGGKPAVIIRVVPMPMGNWKKLRDRDYGLYTREKTRVADFYIRQVERYCIPDLSRHIVVKDIATPATFERYSGSPTGSNYDMSPYPDNFGLKRLKTRTPVSGLFQPKFSHGIWSSMQAGLQVVDMMLHGEIMGGHSRYPGKAGK